MPLGGLGLKWCPFHHNGPGPHEHPTHLYIKDGLHVRPWRFFFFRVEKGSPHRYLGTQLCPVPEFGDTLANYRKSVSIQWEVESKNGLTASNRREALMFVCSKSACIHYSRPSCQSYRLWTGMPYASRPIYTITGTVCTIGLWHGISSITLWACWPPWKSLSTSDLASFYRLPVSDLRIEIEWVSNP